VGVFLLIFLVRTALVAASPSGYLVEVPSGFGGIYEEKSDPRLHYKKIGEPDRQNRHFFLYKDLNHSNTWTLGFGKDFSTVQPYGERQPVQGNHRPLNGKMNLEEHQYQHQFVF